MRLKTLETINVEVEAPAWHKRVYSVDDAIRNV